MIPTCPSCGGAWLYSLTFKHEPTCDLYAADSGRADADYQAGVGLRPATATEAQFIAALGYDPTVTYTIRFDHSGIHRREVYIGNVPAPAPVQ